MILYHLWYFVNAVCETILREVSHLKYPRIRDLREDHDLTQDELVAILQIHKTTYTNYEQGKREIPFCLAIRLAQYYNVSLDYIAGLIPEAQPLTNKLGYRPLY